MNIAEAHKLLVHANTHRGEVFEVGIQVLVGWAKGNSWCEWVRCELPPLVRTDYGYNPETAVDRLGALRTVVQWQDGNDVIVVYGSETADLLRDMPGICLPVIDVQRLVRAANPFWAGGARYILPSVCERLGLKAPSLSAESRALVTGRVLYLLTHAAPADVVQIADACSRLAEEQDNADDRYRAKRTNAPDDNAVAWWTSLDLDERAALISDPSSRPVVGDLGKHIRELLRVCDAVTKHYEVLTQCVDRHTPKAVARAVACMVVEQQATPDEAQRDLCGMADMLHADAAWRASSKRVRDLFPNPNAVFGAGIGARGGFTRDVVPKRIGELRTRGAATQGGDAW